MNGVVCTVGPMRVRTVLLMSLLLASCSQRGQDKGTGQQLEGSDATSVESEDTGGVKNSVADVMDGEDYEEGDDEVLSDLDELLADGDDFALVDSVFCAICREGPDIGFQGLNVPQRTVYLTWGPKGVIDNGGFLRFFEHDFEGFDGHDVAAAFDEIGAHTHANLVREALAFFPDSRPPEDVDKLLETLTAMDEPTGKRFRQLAGKFYAVERDFRRKIGKYVREHAGAFGMCQ